ncbi:MAG: hypothetical protein ACI4MG_06065, partial [Aristaeellaceae bacterium]
SKRLRTSSDFTTEFTTDASGITWTYVTLCAGNGAKYSEKHTKTDLFRRKFTNPDDEAVRPLIYEPRISSDILGYGVGKGP